MNGQTPLNGSGNLGVRVHRGGVADLKYGFRSKDCSYKANRESSTFVQSDGASQLLCRRYIQHIIELVKSSIEKNEVRTNLRRTIRIVLRN